MVEHAVHARLNRLKNTSFLITYDTVRDTVRDIMQIHTAVIHIALITRNTYLPENRRFSSITPSEYRHFSRYQFFMLLALLVLAILSPLSLFLSSSNIRIYIYLILKDFWGF